MGSEGRNLIAGLAPRWANYQHAPYNEKRLCDKDSFWHHAGHGVGMSGWELPWLTPGSDDVIRDCEVLACEPGLYDKSLHKSLKV
jgi:Xaa-Pro aminopeptidase